MMVEIDINGKKKSFSKVVKGLDLVTSKKYVAMKVDGVLMDLHSEISKSCKIDMVSLDSPEGIDIIRHDAAHVLAQAVKNIYPSAQVTIGPTIKDGFYYDFFGIDDLGVNDFLKIEKEMQKIIDDNLQIKRKIFSKDDAIEFFKSKEEYYKVEIIKDIPDTEKISIYFQGEFADLCRGPHAPSTGYIKAFKLMKVSGAYWKGDNKNKMLKRIYGTAWASKEQLKSYLSMLEEIEKRDHRKIGQQMDLFHFQKEAPGAVFWHPKGFTMFNLMIDYIRKRQKELGYLEVSTPEIMSKKLWEDSGHWLKFKENMFLASTVDEKEKAAVRPMNCPGGIQIYKNGSVKSYKDLPIRLAEFGKVFRYEPSGSLHGLMRARSFTQDDAHIFCTSNQITEECVYVCELIKSVYKDFGFLDVSVKFSDRPKNRIGDDNIWDLAENALLKAVELQKLDISFNKGEGAFYGPKLEFVLKDAIGRDWQLGTLQADFNLPSRLNVTFVDEYGKKKHPVILHRALFGSIERFLAILLEHYSGNVPLYFAPTQVVIATITDSVIGYACDILKKLENHGIRCTLDKRNQKINYKIREHFLAKIPILIILGDSEAASSKVCVRRLGSSVPENFHFDDFLGNLIEEVKL